MRWRRKILIFSVAAGIVVMGLLLSGMLAVHLMANRDVVRSLISARAAQATGGKLSYERLTVGYFPFPHLRAEGIGLRRPAVFDLKAAQLSVYLRTWPLLSGRASIRRLVLESPDIQLAAGSGSAAGTRAAPSAAATDPPVDNTLHTVIGGMFGAMTTVESGTDVLIEKGTFALAYPDAPDIVFTDIQLYGENDGGNLSVAMECRSTITGRLDLALHADSAGKQAHGKISAGSLDLRPILHYASLPGGIATQSTQARAEARFTIKGTETVLSRFHLHFPQLMVLRNGRKLDLAAASIAGELQVETDGVRLSVDTLRASRPALNLSGAVHMRPEGQSGRFAFDVHASTPLLDMAVAGRVARVIAGDRAAIRSAFAVAKEGHLVDVTYDARFSPTKSGYRPTRMEAAGHLRRGRIAIPGIGADLERVEGTVVYHNQHVTFTESSGYFKGATFSDLDAAVDWSAEPTLSIESTDVHADAQVFTNWLFSFPALAAAREAVQSIDGGARLSMLAIKGPLTRPSAWEMRIRGTPENLRIASPLASSRVRLTGGEIAYMPGSQKATDVAVTYLDGSVIASIQAEGLMKPPVSVYCHLDGSLGPQAIDWLSTILPIPEHLQMKPPVDLAAVKIAWTPTAGTSFEGSLKTAGGVDLFADVSIFPQTWNIRRLHFADDHSQALISARGEADRIEMAFTGHVDRATADHLLEANRTLTGRLEGDFRAIIDTRTPLNSAIAGQLSGEGLQIHQLFSDPITVQRFSIEGRAGRILVGPSELRLQGSRLIVDGSLRNGSGKISFDLNVDADRLDTALIRSIQSVGEGQPDSGEQQTAPAAATYTGAVRIRTDAFSHGKWVWSPVEATVHIDRETIRVHVDRADLCGIATTGELIFSPDGLRLSIEPRAQAASLQETAICFWDQPVQTDARFDLAGKIQLPEETQDPLQRVSGHVDLSSQNGRIAYSSVLMKIFAVLNITEIFTSSGSDLTEKGYGYTTAQVKSRIEGGKLLLDEILLDGNSLKITGQGHVDLKSRYVDVRLLAAPLKTVDRVVNKLPVINYISGGSLVSIPLRITGRLDDVSVAAMPPSAVGKGLLNIMGRTLKAPFKLVQQAASLATGNAAPKKQAPDEPTVPIE